MSSKLSPNFTLEEFTFSQTAIRNGVDNEPSSEILAQLVKTAHSMELVRSFLGNRAIRVSSAYRSPKVNSLVGGSSTSAHCRGEAIDFTVAGMTPKEVAQAISKSSLQFDQLILEFDRWVHMSFTDKPRQQVLTAIRGADGKTRYVPGII